MSHKKYPERIMPGDLIPVDSIQQHLSRYAFASKFVEGKVVLELGCGIGYGSRYLREKGAAKVMGVDNSVEAIEIAKRYYQTDGVEFVLLDATRLNFADESSDCVVAFEIIEHLREQEDFLKECYRVLKKGGTFICSTPNREIVSPDSSQPLWPWHVKEFNINEFSQLISRYYTDVFFYGQPDPDLILAQSLLFKLAVSIRKRMECLPYSDKIVNLVTHFIFRHHRRVKFTPDLDLDKIGEAQRYWPLPLQGSSFIPLSIIAVAKVEK